jgi:hypothetical protein
VIGENVRIDFKRILCPTDLSPESDEVLRYAIGLALVYEAKLFVLPTTETSFITHTEVSALQPIAHAIHPAPLGVGTQTSAGVSPPSAEPLAKCASLHYEYFLCLHLLNGNASIKPTEKKPWAASI